MGAEGSVASLLGLRNVIQHGTNKGRHGKGIIYLFAAGNKRYGSANLEYEYEPGYGWTNFDVGRIPQTMSICAINANGMSSPYSNFGSNLLVCAPSDSRKGDQAPGITTTLPYKTPSDKRYTDEFGGTSAATAMVSGVVALILQARPDLTWRDVRLILARTARILPEMKPDPKAPELTKWVTTHAINPYTKKPYQYSLIYGFGLIDAAAAVKYAKNFQTTGDTSEAWWSQNCDNEIAFDPSQRISKQPQGMEILIPMSCGKDKKVEFAEATIDVKHERFRDLEITLTTPNNTEIPLTSAYPYCGGTKGERDCPTSEFGNSYRTSVTMPLDEAATGNWVIRIKDKGHSNKRNLLKGVALTIH